MENFFLEGYVYWRHERAQWEYEARSRNWIWVDKFTSYVIIVICVSNCVVEVLTSVIFECLRFLIHLTGDVIDWFFFLSFLGRITSSLDGVRINI